MAQNILIIDDDSLTVSLLSLLLKSKDFVVAQASNGTQGLDILSESNIDLVLCDIEMPDIDGYEVLKKAREAGFQKPFIFLSARDSWDEQRAGMNSGADDYLIKPVVPEELFRSIESRLSSSSYLLAQKAVDLDKFKSFLSRALPHEFRTPLGLISGYADILASTDLDSEQQKDIGKTIKKSASRLARITENYLLLSLDEAENFLSQPDQAEKEHVCCKVLIEDLSKAIAKKSEREMDLLLEVREGQISCTTRAIEKIAGELIENAFKFSIPGDQVIVTGNPLDNDYLLSIADSGRGMTAKQLDSLSSFTQHDRERYEQQGLGLGLEVVRSLINLAGGTIELSRLEKGLDVKVRLPLKTA